MTESFTQADYTLLKARLDPRIDGVVTELQETLEKYSKDSNKWRHLKSGWLNMIDWAESAQRWPEVDTIESLDQNTGRKVLYLTLEDFENLSQEQLNRYPFIVIKKGYPKSLFKSKLHELKQSLQHRPNGTINIQTYILDGKRSPPIWNAKASTTVAQRISEMITAQEQGSSKPIIRDSTATWKHRVPWNFLNLDGNIVETMSSPTIIHASLRLLYFLVEELKNDGTKNGFGKPYDKLDQVAYYSDVQSCLRFLILGEKGTFSGNHLDILSGTWVLGLCGLKIWWIFTGEFTDEAQKEFAAKGVGWDPGAGAMQMLPIEPGDYMMMMPGHLCAHAPYTVDDCLMTGGMFWNDSMIPQLFKNIAFTCQNNARVSNEGVPRQLPRILSQLRNRPNMTEDIVKAIDTAEKLLRPLLSCNCESGEECGSECRCANPDGMADKHWREETWYRSRGCTDWCNCDCRKDGIILDPARAATPLEQARLEKTKAEKAKPTKVKMERSKPKAKQRVNEQPKAVQEGLSGVPKKRGRPSNAELARRAALAKLSTSESVEREASEPAKEPKSELTREKQQVLKKIPQLVPPSIFQQTTKQTTEAEAISPKETESPAADSAIGSGISTAGEETEVKEQPQSIERPTRKSREEQTENPMQNTAAIRPRGTLLKETAIQTKAEVEGQRNSTPLESDLTTPEETTDDDDTEDVDDSGTYRDRPRVEKRPRLQ